MLWLHHRFARLPMVRFLGVFSALILSASTGAWAAEAGLVLKRTSATFTNGDPLWQLQLIRAGKVLKSWNAAASAKGHQGLDRLWTPGNGSPLPRGVYRVGAPEPWGRDIWIQLNPLFATRRSGLGIHNCYPGVGCICIPDRQQLTSLATAVRHHNVKRLTVVD